MVKKAKKTAKAKHKKRPIARKKPIAKARKKPAKKSAAKRKQTISAIPAGYHSITPYLIVSDTANAIIFYKNAFGAKEVMRMEHADGKIAHAELKIGDAKIMLADEHPEMGAHSPRAYGGSPITLHFYTKKVDAIVEKALESGAKLLRPVENMFYGDRTGTIEDPYGHKWFIATHIENVSRQAMKKRAAAIFGKKP